MLLIAEPIKFLSFYVRPTYRLPHTSGTKAVLHLLIVCLTLQAETQCCTYLSSASHFRHKRSAAPTYRLLHTSGTNAVLHLPIVCLTLQAQTQCCSYSRTVPRSVPTVSPARYIHCHFQ